MSGFIYVVILDLTAITKAKPPLKIGYSAGKSAAARISALRRSLPFPLKVVGIFPHSKDGEKELLTRLHPASILHDPKNENSGTEWFHSSPRVAADFLRKVKQGVKDDLTTTKEWSELLGIQKPTPKPIPKPKPVVAPVVKESKPEPVKEPKVMAKANGKANDIQVETEISEDSKTNNRITINVQVG